MKTPRDILLDRHQGALPALDAIGDDILSGLEPTALEERSMSWWAFLKAEWLAPFRMQWAGIGIAWVVIVLLQLGAGHSSAPKRQVIAKDTDLEERIEERRIMLAELLEDQLAAVPQEEPDPAYLKPRSDASCAKLAITQTA